VIVGKNASNYFSIMLPEPKFQFKEELVKKTLVKTGSTQINSSISSSNIMPSLEVGDALCRRVSLKRPSKLELSINLNELQDALSSSTISALNSSKVPKNLSQNHTTNSSSPLSNQNFQSAGLISTSKKKKRRQTGNLESNNFSDIYSLTGEILGQGSYGKVSTCKNIYTCQEYAVKIIDKFKHPNRDRVFKEIEIYMYCRDCVNIIKIIEFFEDAEKFYIVFEKMNGGSLLNQIKVNGRLTERDASLVVKEIATALNFLHSKGMAHRDLKLENILCQYSDSVITVKICDFDLGSSIKINNLSNAPVTTPELSSPVSLSFLQKLLKGLFITHDGAITS
jgi:hypothetical protein